MPSVITLLIFAIASICAAVYGFRHQHPWWSYAPFVVTSLGASIGFLYETSLILLGFPYQLFGPRIGRGIQTIRAGLFGLVFGMTYLAFCLFVFGGSSEEPWLCFAVGVVTGFILVCFMFRAPPQVGIAVLSLGLLAQIGLLYAAKELPGGDAVRFPLLAAAIALYVSAAIGAPTPFRSAVFHIVGIAAVLFLHVGAQRYFATSPKIVATATIYFWLRLIVAIPLGAFIAFRLFPSTWAVLRSSLANFIWPYFYLIIAGGGRVARPSRLSVLYRGQEDRLRPLKLMPYYMAHPRNLTHPVSIPCLDESLTVKVHALGFFGRLVKFVFAVASIMDRLFPFVSISTPLRLKPRMERWSDGSDYWPGWLLEKTWLPRLGWFSIQSGVRGPGFQATPELALEMYREGQLLAYLVEYGAAGSFLRPVIRNNKQAFLMDFSFLEGYESKPDYERYGGTAFFEIDDNKKCLRLTHLRGPRSPIEVEADPNHATFRHIEDIILSSFYFYIVSGKHLVEIHMGLNLLEVALFNAFDARQDWRHPVRQALYPHLFAHELAEELTTQHLLEDNATFSQIFATTGPALMRHLNERFAEYQLGVDEDFEEREKVLLTGRTCAQLEDVLPDCGLVWEKQYFKAWLEYTTTLVHATFVSDLAVERDEGVQTLFTQLSAMFNQELPRRYAKLKTRRGLARFMADILHHLIIRHEVYGTTAVRLSLDPRISKVQVPKDGGPYAIDEWRSLACIALATSRVRYTLLMETDWSDVFNDITDQQIRANFKTAYQRLKRRLRVLQRRWESDGRDNYETLRVLPDELDIGAGY